MLRAQEHYHAKQTVVEEEQTVEELLEDVKQQYDLHGEALQRAQGQRATLEEARDTVTLAVDKLVEQVRLIEPRPAPIWSRPDPFYLSIQPTSSIVGARQRG